MPDLSDASFRAHFYSRWGRETAIICAQTRFAEYPRFRQCLSVKAAWHGQEDYFVDNRRLAVDDDVYLILNEDRHYASRISAPELTTSFSIFFRPGMANEVLGSLIEPADRLLADPGSAAEASIEFHEALSRHDTTVSPILKYLHAVCRSGFDDEIWYEEQLHMLLERMLIKQRACTHDYNRLNALKSATRRELYQRVTRAADFIQSNYASRLELAELARRSCMSPHHFLRSFRDVFGSTPYQYLLAKRASVAGRLLAGTKRSITDIGAGVGFDCRSAFYRSFKKIHGLSPAAYREAAGI